MRKELRETDWRKLLNGDAIDDWMSFRDRLLLESKYISVQKSNCGKRKKIWINNRAVRSVNRKRKVFRKYKDRNHPACKEASRKAAVDVRNARLIFETKLADNIKYDSKSFFAYVRVELGYVQAHCCRRKASGLRTVRIRQRKLRIGGGRILFLFSKQEAGISQKISDRLV